MNTNDWCTYFRFSANFFALEDSTVILCCGQRVIYIIERIFPNREFWLDKVALIQHFFTVAILPELLGKFYSRTEEPKVTSSTAQDPCGSGTLEDTTDGKDHSSTSSKI